MIGRLKEVKELEKRYKSFDRKLANALKLIDETGPAIPKDTANGGQASD